MESAPQDYDPEGPDPVVGPSKPRLLGVLGPGLITGASDDDPSGIATYSQVGAAFGYGLSWTLLFSYPLMVAIQMISARIGRTTGHGIAGVLRLHYPNWLLQWAVVLLLVANIINLGADLGAMADAMALLLPGPRLLYVLLFSVICVCMQLLLQYTRYVAVLKWFTLSLFAYFAVLAVVHLDWMRLATRLVIPDLHWNAGYLTAVVAVFGTTISPYLFFWQSEEEVEDMHVHPKRQDLFDAPQQGSGALHRIEIDTVAGMGLSNLVALAILATTAATLNVGGITDIQTSAQAAQALRPIAGSFAALFFTTGIVGTGLLSVPVLAGSAAYAIGEARSWPVGFTRKVQEAKAFYATIAIATLIGMIVNFTSINAIKALYWSAVLNGVVAVPIMIVMMLVASRADIMGRFVVQGRLRMLGWLATLVMLVIALAMLATSF
ncbi:MULTISPECIES: NRAMP family divalent metal transporter [Burkholderia cepacia complex]|uniref:Divalent metal cation transporter MntH n=1 Tax=Burkholderia pseudomultivorans TaxID=1207504 RepID=A0ABU2E1A3_9BURK|nr:MULTISPECIES: divalent metal cation transporter [Burkholderia cepacia complex]MDN8068982.1 divalent metal cation transporter [Burkholderia vietnamiensis]MDR8728257.1 Divalent metal cation transporter MntH [Burkholderia pseudomultivorans]MDR8735225.1 Divalent metal cation transporter MntH [Burkholderia pseudomultivorans]MDR8741399.1 Divalent metal cation transporter MntH [Burkholderia pseudomultivorans]MDR8753647.1 Divalent metal cation transporter MntH [Burkholderia pseudomultivorans]